MEAGVFFPLICEIVFARIDHNHEICIRKYVCVSSEHWAYLICHTVSIYIYMLYDLFT